MTNIVDTSYFRGRLLIANTVDSSYVQSYLSGIITQLQYDFLLAILGPVLYAQFDTWYAIDPLDQTNPFYKLLKGDSFTLNSRAYRWIGLAPVVLMSPIANYVYYHYQRDNVTQTVSAGEVKTDSQNATPASPGTKMVAAWNDMVDMNSNFIWFMDKYYADNEDWITQRSQIWSLSPIWSNCLYGSNQGIVCRDLFEKINTFNL